jgi:hypothetical protein
MGYGYKKKFKRKYEGNVPSDNYTKQRWKIHDPSGVYWSVFIREFDRNSVNWINVKLKINAGRAMKANYWFGYSLNDRRFAKSSDIQHMQTKNPQLYNEVSRVFSALSSENIV